MKNNFQAAYNEALELSKAELRGRVPELICDSSGARLVTRYPHPTVELTFIGSTVIIEFSDSDFFKKNPAEIHIWDKLLLLHYLLHASAERSSARLITFKELKSAAQYDRVFEGRCVRPLLKAFGDCPDRLLTTALRLGGQPVSAGDAAAEVQVLPKIPLRIILWKADEEFPASANILFPENIESFLPAEDIVVLCQRVVLKLLR